MDHFPLSWGRPRNEAVDLYSTYPVNERQRHGPRNDAFAEGVQHTQQPIVTGTSVLAIRYKDGIMMAADCLGSYGSMARFKDVSRLHAVGQYTLIGAGGDLSDYQYLQHILNSLMIDEYTADDGHKLGPDEIYHYLSQVMYARRSKMDPLWNTLLVGGFKDGKSFIGYVDLLGVTYTASTLATGYGAYIALPLLRKAVEGREHELTEEEARAIITECMKVLFYRDARSLNKFQIATVTERGVEIGDAISAQTEWSFAEKLSSFGPKAS